MRVWVVIFEFFAARGISAGWSGVIKEERTAAAKTSAGGLLELKTWRCLGHRSFS